MKCPPLSWLLALLVCCAGAHAQEPLIPPPTNTIQGAPFALTVLNHRHFYSGGGGDSMESTQRIARDSSGRQRLDALVLDHSEGSRIADIYDVVAGKMYHLNLRAKTAQVFPMSVGRTVRLDAAAAPASVPSKPAAGQTLLGTRKVIGQEAWGQQTTRNIVAADGATVAESRELWLSITYRMPLLQVLHNPDFQVTQTVVEFHGAEPDPALFRIPEGFAVHDPPGPTPDTVPVGGEVSAPVLLKMVQPTYSPEGRDRRAVGDVLLQVVIDERGMPQDVRVIRDLGSGLDERAVAAVRQYRFKPAMRGGVPVKVELNINVNFQIF